MPIASGIYIITNVKQRNPVFLENRNDEESIRGHHQPENLGAQTQARWHWCVVDLGNGLHSIRNFEHKRYAYSGSRAGLNASVMGANEEQQWHIQEISGKGEYTIGAIDSPNFWMLPDKGKRTPVELFDVPTDRTCWWTFTNVETGNPVREDATYGAYLFALKPLPILPFSPLRLDFIIIQQMSNDSIANASRTIAGVCGRLVSLRRIQSDAVCVNIIEIMAVESDIFFERSYEVVTFEKLRHLGSPDILWEECNGASALPTMAMRGLRPNTAKIAILNLSHTLFQLGGQAIINLIDGLAEHDITLVLAPVQPTWERTFAGTSVFRELKERSSEYRRFRQEGQFSDYVINYNKAVALPGLKRHPEIRDEIRQNIPHIVEILKDNDQNTQSTAVAALSQLAEYAELLDAILETVPKIVEMLAGTRGEAKAAASALTKLAEHALFCDVFNTKDNNGLTPLSVAAANGHEAVICILLAHPAVDVNAKDEDGSTPLFWAALLGHEPVVRLLLTHPGTDVNASRYGATPLWGAASRGQDVVVSLLLAHARVDVNAKNNDGLTTLFLAALLGHEPVLRLLLAHPAVNVNVSGRDGTVLSRAASRGNDAVVRLLLAHPGINVNAKDKGGCTPLLCAAATGNDAVVRLLLAHPDVDVNAKDKGGSTPLFCAADTGNDAMVRLLLAHPNVDVNAIGHDVTPISRAASRRHNGVVRLLLAHPGININAKDKGGFTPLFRAAATGNDTMVRLLLAHPDVDVNAKYGKAKYRVTPLAVAASGGHDLVVKLLQEHIRQMKQPKRLWWPFSP